MIKELPLIIGIVVFIVIAFFNRFKQEKALTLLSNEEKGAIVSAFAAQRTTNLYLLLGCIILGYILSMYVFSTSEFGGFFNILCIIPYVIIVQLRARKTYKEMEVDPQYVATIHKTQKLNLLGVVVISFGALWSFFLY